MRGWSGLSRVRTALTALVSGLAFLCMAAADDGARLPFAFLTEVMSRFFAAYPTEWKTASDLQLDAFGRVLQSRMEFFNNDPEADKIRRVRGEVDKVKTVMLDNIEKVIARGDNIEELVDKTYQLSSSSQEFRVQSKHLEKRLCWCVACASSNVCGLFLLTCAQQKCQDDRHPHLRVRCGCYWHFAHHSLATARVRWLQVHQPSRRVNHRCPRHHRGTHNHVGSHHHCSTHNSGRDDHHHNHHHSCCDDDHHHHPRTKHVDVHGRTHHIHGCTHHCGSIKANLLFYCRIHGTSATGGPAEL